MKLPPHDYACVLVRINYSFAERAVASVISDFLFFVLFFIFYFLTRKQKDSQIVIDADASLVPTE